MVSLIHEGLIALVRDRPSFVAELLSSVLGLPVPPFKEARITEAELTELVPVEYDADAAVLLVDDTPVYGVIVEAQLSTNVRKHYTWPLYAVAARARHECPFVVLVVTPDHSVESWARQPIDLGNDMIFRPHVIGPAGIPMLTDVDRAREDPQLAVLSAIAHGHGEARTALKISHAALVATSHLPSDQQLIYSSLIRRALSDAARKAFEMIPNPQKYVDEWRQEIAEEALAEGQAKGLVEGQALAVLKLLNRRGVAVSEDQRERITTCTDLAMIDRWLDQAFVVVTVDELFR